MRRSKTASSTLGAPRGGRPVPKLSPASKRALTAKLAGLDPRLLGRVSGFWNGMANAERAVTGVRSDGGRLGERGAAAGYRLITLAKLEYWNQTESNTRDVDRE